MGWGPGIRRLSQTTQASPVKVATSRRELATIAVILSSSLTVMGLIAL